VHKHRDENIEKIKAYDRIRGRSEARKLANVSRSKRDKAVDPVLYNKRYYEYNKKGDAAKKAARQKIESAIVSGKMIRPDRCNDCGIECKPHGHHEDYSKPLAVIWLCTACHGIRHRKC
jgi:hypothetical protein